MPNPFAKPAAVLKALFATKEAPNDAVSAAILAHLAEHGRTRTQDLLRIFRKGPASVAGRVSIAQVMLVLERLEDDGEIYAIREGFQGRVQPFWNLNTFGGGKRERNRDAAHGAGSFSGALATA